MKYKEKLEILKSLQQIMNHCRKCSICRVKFESIIEHAKEVGDYKVEDES